MLRICEATSKRTACRSARRAARTVTEPLPSREMLLVASTARIVESAPSSLEVTSASTMRAEAPG